MTQPVALLAVRPHPDDESSATGGLLAKYAAAGLRTAVVTCTGGEEGEIHDPSLDLAATRERLAEIRERELRAACDVLGVAELRLLGYRDSGMPGTPANVHSDAFVNAELDAAAGRLAELIRELRPTVVITEDEHGTYGHPDHVMCHRVTMRAWELAGDPRAPLARRPWRPSRLYVLGLSQTWEEVIELMRRDGLDTSWFDSILECRRERVPALRAVAPTAAIDVSAHTETQRQALLRHRTQIPPDNFFVSLPSHLHRRAFSTVHVLRVQPPPREGERDADLMPEWMVATAS